jgi:hypothetical protein
MFHRAKCRDVLVLVCDLSHLVRIATDVVQLRTSELSCHVGYTDLKDSMCVYISRWVPKAYVI